MKKFFLSAALVCAAGSFGFAESVIKPLNDKMAEHNLGEFSGELRLLYMEDNFRGNTGFPGEGNAHSTTGSIKLNYKSAEFGGLQLGASYINANVFESGGGSFDEAIAGDSKGEYWLANGQLNVLNELYLNYNMQALGMGKTNLRIGRQVLESTDGAWQGLDFLVKKDIRHKAQAIEGVVLTSQDIENLTLSIGHIDKFSNWGWSDKDGDGFDNVEDAYGLGGLVNDTKGVQFVSATFTGIDKLALTVYDFYGQNMYNTFGTKAFYTLNDKLSFKVHFAHQDSIGEYDDLLALGGTQFDSDLLDISVTTKVGSMDVEAGMLSILSSTDANNIGNFATPFDFFAVPADQLLVYTNSFAAGADSYYVQGRGMITDKIFLLAMYTYTNHDNSNVLYDAQEVDMILSYNVTENFSIATLGALGWRSGVNGGPSGHASDFRLFASYKF